MCKVALHLSAPTHSIASTHAPLCFILLPVVWSEIEIRQDRVDTVECIVSELLAIYSRIVEPDVNRQGAHSPSYV